MNNIHNSLKTRVIITILIFLFPLGCFANEIVIDYSNSGSVPITRSGSVSIMRADIIEISPLSLTIAGQLKRMHATPTSGHLHSYTYSDKEELLADSKHKVLGLRSQRGGVQRIPFSLRIENPNQEVSRILFEYHRSGYKES